MGDSVTAKFHKDVQVNGVLHKAGVITEVPADYWLTEGHRHGELVVPLPETKPPAPKAEVKEEGLVDQLKTVLSTKPPKAKESK